MFRLWLRLAAAVAFAAVIPLLILAVYAGQIAVDENRKGTEERQLREANGVAQIVEAWIAAQRDSLVGWTVPFATGSDPDLQRGLLRAVLLANPALVSAVLVHRDNARVVEPQFVDAAMAAQGGRAAGSAERAAALIGQLPLDLAVEAYEASVARGDDGPVGGAVGATWRYAPDSGPSVPIAAIGPYDPGLVYGAEVSLAYLEGVVASQSTPTHRVAIVDVEGHTVVGDATGAAKLAVLLPSGTDANFALADEGLDGAIAVVPTPDWRVVVFEPAEQSASAVGQIRYGIGFVLIVSVGLASLVGLVLARSLAEPVRELSEGALRVADGEYGRKVAEDRADEIGDLQRAFNHMSTRLAAGRDEIARQQAQIEGMNRDLQARVDERTRELVEAQARLVQSGQLAAVAEMGAGLAHELNNPIAAILGTAQVVRMRIRGTPDEERVARIEEQAERCRDVVATMLRLSEGGSEGGNTADSVDVVDLTAMLGEVAALVAAPFRQRGVNLVVESGEPSLAVKATANPVATSRVLAQVLQSFRSGLPDGARLVVRTRVQDGRAAVVFEPDRPVAKGTARDDWMASGMALWVARRQLEAMNGRLDEPATGETAWVLSLPLVHAASPAPAASAS